MRVAVIGAGNGGLATAVELGLAGHDVHLYARREETLAPLRPAGIGHEGVLGEGRFAPALLTCDLAAAMRGVEAAVVALPTYAHAGVSKALHAVGATGVPVILNPGHTGGLFETETAFRALGGPVPPIATFATLAYVARKPRPDAVSVTGRARALRAASLASGAEALALACALFPGAYDGGDVLACDLSNVNMILHPPGAVLGMAWVERTGGDFTFYVDGLTPGVVAVMRALDDERRAIARAFGHALPTVIGEMKAIGTVPAEARDDDYAAIAAGAPNRRIRAPDRLAHRYYTEDFAHGLTPMLVYAAIAGVKAPVAGALLSLVRLALAGLPDLPHDRDARALGLEGVTREALLARVAR